MLPHRAFISSNAETRNASQCVVLSQRLRDFEGFAAALPELVVFEEESGVFMPQDGARNSHVFAVPRIRCPVFR